VEALPPVAPYTPDRYARRVGKILVDAFTDWFGIGEVYARVLLVLYQSAGEPITWRDLGRTANTHHPMARGAVHEAISSLREALESEAIDRDESGYWLTEVGFSECRRAFRELGQQLIGVGAEPANESHPLRTPADTAQ
jgi:hypothetical protein